MSKTFVTAWADTPFLDEEVAEVSLATAQEISDVIDVTIFAAVSSQETSSTTIESDLIAVAELLLYPTVVDGGDDYLVDDILTLVGGTFVAPATIRVITQVDGEITNVKVVSHGDYSVLPDNPVSVTGGSGIGGAVNLTQGSGLVDAEQKGPLLLEALAAVTAVGVAYADINEVSPPGALLRATFVLTFDFDELEERPEHLDDAVEDYFSNQDWVT